MNNKEENSEDLCLDFVQEFGLRSNSFILKPVSLNPGRNSGQPLARSSPAGQPPNEKKSDININV